MRNSSVGYKPTVPFRKTYGLVADLSRMLFRSELEITARSRETAKKAWEWERLEWRKFANSGRIGVEVNIMSINMHERASSEQPCVIVVGDAPPEIQSEIVRMRRLAETAPLISTNPERMSGTPVIGIERLPVSSLISHLIAGYTVEEFIEAFDTDRDRVYAILEKIKEALETGWLAEPVDY